MTTQLCRSCGASALKIVLSLGSQPLANALLTPDQLALPELRYPLDLALCLRCSLLQITETVPPEVLFREYLYFSSYSDTMLAHARDLVERLTTLRRLDAGGLVVEIASNDGYLLQYYKEKGVDVLGIEPAVNVARVAEERGIPTIKEFFGEALARRLVGEGVRATVLHAHNVLAHVADLNGFVAGIQCLLAPGGTAVIEVPYAKDMIDRCEFDTIYHEHLCYFSFAALAPLFQRHRLAVGQVERVPIHGGSLRLFLGHAGGSASPSVEALRREEAEWGAQERDFYESFARRVESLKKQLLELLRRLKGEGHRLAAYGAAAKGAILLNTAGIGAETLDFVVDRNPHKQGRFLPGARVPIVAPERLLADRPAFVLLLAWNLAEEILQQQSEYRKRGGRFILPIPEVRVV